MTRREAIAAGLQEARDHEARRKAAGKSGAGIYSTTWMDSKGESQDLGRRIARDIACGKGSVKWLGADYDGMNHYRVEGAGHVLFIEKHYDEMHP